MYDCTSVSLSLVASLTNNSFLELQAGTIDPEWHGWLHNMTDDMPTKVTYFKPHYELKRSGYNESVPYQPKASYSLRSTLLLPLQLVA